MIMMYNFFSLDTNQFFLIASQEIFEGIWIVEWGMICPLFLVLRNSPKNQQPVGEGENMVEIVGVQNFEKETGSLFHLTFPKIYVSNF